MQSGFVPGDSSANQLVDIYNTFSKALDDCLKVKAVFCDMSKAFDHVWHKGLVLKLKSVGSLLGWFQNYLSANKDLSYQGVLPLGKYKCGCTPRLYFRTTLFLIYINDIVKDINSIIRLFADDTSLYIIADSPEEASQTINQDLVRISAWAEKWLVYFNPNKTEYILLSR